MRRGWVYGGLLPGVLLLGRFFSWWDVVAYWVGIGVAAGADDALGEKMGGR